MALPERLTADTDAVVYGAIRNHEAIQLAVFIDESNRIEGIYRDPTEDERIAWAAFMVLDTIRLADIEGFVREIAKAPLRCKPGMDVRVGNHRPIPGGPPVEAALETILRNANEGTTDPYRTHIAYERIHPFMDGNGRSGRALWAWQMKRAGQDPFALPFLHRWYYQSLDASRKD